MFRAVTPGTALQPQDPLHVRRSATDATTTASEPLAELRRYGWGTEVRGNRYPAWLHFPLSVDSAAASVSVGEVRVRFSTRGGGALTAVHLWDGAQRIAYNDHVDAPPLVDQGGNRIRPPVEGYVHVERFPQPAVARNLGLGVSLLWRFSAAIDDASLAAVTFHEVTVGYAASAA